MAKSAVSISTLKKKRGELVRLKKVVGFVLHGGYVESNIVGTIFIHSQEDGFDTEKEAAADLAHFFLEDYLYESSNDLPSLDGFCAYLAEQPGRNASAGPSFCVVHWNAERWWAWDAVHQLVPYFDRFFEIDEPMEQVLPYYLDPEKIEDEEFREEIKQLHVPDPEKDAYPNHQRKRALSDAVFVQLVKTPRAEKKPKTR